ncbi:hypothetical protein B0H13DRAFT_1885788 [Mycena leptocephala]|nr:hypothetical protein B0H13DRAFT_1885788 [Mycena leptocephala]
MLNQLNTCAALLTPTSGALALGLSISVGVLVAVRRRMCMVKTPDCELLSSTTAAGPAGDHEPVPEQEDLAFSHLFVCSSDDHLDDSSVDDDLSSHVYFEVKTLSTFRAVEFTTGDVHCALSAAVEVYDPEPGLDFGYFFATAFVDDSEDNDEGEIYPSMEILQRVTSGLGVIQHQQEVHWPCVAETGVVPGQEDLAFNYFLAGGLLNDEDEAETEEPHSSENDSDTPVGYPFGHWERIVSPNAPAPVHVQLREVGSTTPSVFCGGHHKAYKAGLRRKQARSTSAVLAPRSPLIVKRTTSISSFAIKSVKGRVKGKDENEKEKENQGRDSATRFHARSSRRLPGIP